MCVCVFTVQVVAIIRFEMNEYAFHSYVNGSNIFAFIIIQQIRRDSITQ